MEYPTQYLVLDWGKMTRPFPVNESSLDYVLSTTRLKGN